jgi:hypothetical protein
VMRDNTFLDILDPAHGVDVASGALLYRTAMGKVLILPGLHNSGPSHWKACGWPHIRNTAA